MVFESTYVFPSYVVTKEEFKTIDGKKSVAGICIGICLDVGFGIAFEFGEDIGRFLYTIFH